MISVSDFLQHIRGRLSMFIGAESLSRLADFVRGYECALSDAGLLDDPCFLSGFQDFIERKFQLFFFCGQILAIHIEEFGPE